MKKIAVVGVYGTGPDFTTGQAVKCHTVIDWLRKEYGEKQVVVVNTYNWKKHPLNLFVELFKSMKECKNIIIMPAQNGLRVFAPLTYYINQLFNRNILYIVIGGWLASTLDTNKKLRKYVGSFSGVFVETNSMKKALEEEGLKNIFYMPNSRDITTHKLGRKIESGNIIKTCTYSRVVKSKGIEDAILICKRANEILGSQIFKLDVYGKIANDYEKEFNEIIKKNSNIVTYCGCKNADETMSVLCQYFVLIFPTYYEGEGFAGTILDAFAAELPIIANDWKYNAEIIENGRNGFIYPYRDIEAAARMLIKLYNNHDLYKNIQLGCRKSAIEYSTENIMNKFTRMIC